LQDESRLKLGSDQFYFKSADQMKDLFKDHPEAIENTLRIAEQCKVEFKLKDATGKPIYHLPSFPTENGRSLKDEIKEMALKGLENRIQEVAKTDPILQEDKPIYLKRLNYELDVIENMGFSGYFMIVQDFINWAKMNSIPVGPGRGSGAGSLVAYSLNITDLDPIKNKLIFERFLNPERISMPDFDIDFCQDRRGEVIRYVTSKYGEACVSQIITFGKLQARAAIRDVGRVMGMSFQEVDVLSKLLPDKLGLTLEEALTMEPRIQELMDQDPRMATLIDIARKIEGLHRHASIHAAGVIISNQPLTKYAPLYKGVEGENVVQYDMKNSEKIGLIKFDFLGLKTLTHIDNALKLIEKNRGKKMKPSDISMTDPGIYELMSRGDTAGVFQFEGGGMTDFLRKL
jgi:DNA polymerase-3 subunit alpha